MTSTQRDNFQLTYGEPQKAPIIIESLNFFILKNSDYLFGAGKNDAETCINNTIWSSTRLYGKLTKKIVLQAPSGTVGRITYIPQGSQQRFNFFGI